MTAHATLGRLQTFLHLLAMGLFLGTIAELLSVKHYGDPVQLIPFALTGIGLIALALVWVHPSQLVMRTCAGLMAVIASGSLLGVFEHVEGNLSVLAETHRNPTIRQQLGAVLTGDAPLLAPGTLAIAAAIGLAALYARRSLRTTTDDEHRIRLNPRPT
jgi:hypothetical protein